MNDDAMRRARSRLEELIKQAAQILTTKRKGEIGHYLDDQAGYMEWRMKAMTILAILASNSHHQAEFRKIDESTGWTDLPSKLGDQVSVLKALLNDIDGGYLTNLRGLIRAEVFADFLQQAEHLFDEGYWQPVPVIVGAVLEDHLRKLCGKHPTITLAARPKLNAMNDELAKAGQYNALRQKQVTVWADVRNKAAHGKFEEFKESDAEAMLRDVPAFLADNAL